MEHSAEIPLRERARRTFDSALRRAGAFPELSGLRELLSGSREDLERPMRVALVGQIKAGKSTMLNALLGEKLAPTGAQELTFNVNRFHHGPASKLIVRYKNGRDPEERSFAELEELTRRRDENRDLLKSIREIEIQHPNAILRTFDLIDTPGLRSFFKDDSLNTSEYLGLTPEEVEEKLDEAKESTRRESKGAHALVVVFRRNLALSDHSMVSEFQGETLSHATPINAIGVLNGVESYWKAEEPEADPFDDGHRIAARIHSEPEVKRVFYTVLPVCALVAEGAETIVEDELGTLEALAALPPEILAKRLRYAKRFTTRDYEELPPAEARARLFTRLGQYGIWLAAQLRRQGLQGSELREELFRRSGVADLRELITAHFGHRALLIKAQTRSREVREEARRLRQRLEGEERSAAAAVGGKLEKLETSVGAFDEFDLLRRHYEPREEVELQGEEEQELLRVTGERGTLLSLRLGLDERASPQEIESRAQERLSHWRSRQDAFGATSSAREAASGMARAYERILHHGREVRTHLELEGAPVAERSSEPRKSDRRGIRRLFGQGAKVQAPAADEPPAEAKDTLATAVAEPPRVESPPQDRYPELTALLDLAGSRRHSELQKDEEPEIDRLLGANGTTLAERLGLEKSTLPAEMEPRVAERLANWRARKDAFGADRQTVITAAAMTAVYERLMHEVRQARRHMEPDK